MEYQKDALKQITFLRDAIIVFVAILLQYIYQDTSSYLEIIGISFITNTVLILFPKLRFYKESILTVNKIQNG